VGFAGTSQRQEACVTGDGSAPGSGGDGGENDAHSWTPVERALLAAALEFYGAAGGVIEFTDDKHPQLRHSADGFKAIREAMAALERCVVAAHAAGTSAERIAQIARIERETIDLILQRQAAAPSSDEG
jgi:hypothetical protein